MVAFFIFSCGEKNTDNRYSKPLFTLMEKTGIEFSNTIVNTGDFNIFSYRNFYNGGGVAAGDINNDGLTDLFFTANMGSNKLFLNKGNWNFVDISQQAGIEDMEEWSTGVVFVDVNNDGWLDIYVCNAGYIDGKLPESRLYINNKDLTFTDAAVDYGLTNKGGYATQAAFFDYDMDGDLDCFIINNSFIPVNTLNYANKRNLRAPEWPVADFLKGGGDHLYRNDHGKFVNVSEAAGIYGSLISFGLGATVGDVNGDLYPDIYVSNDFFEKDYLYINQKDGTFKDQLEAWMEHTSLSSMGGDMADINNDGFPDIFTTDMLPEEDGRVKTTTSFDSYDVYRFKEDSGFYRQFTQNTLHLNSGAGKFYETAFYSGVAASDWSWGGLIFDADNDGWNDIFVCNGIKYDVTNMDFINFFADELFQRMTLTGKKEEIQSVMGKMPSVPVPNKAFKNNGDLTFTDVAKKWGLSQKSFSNGSVYADLDNDGDLDLITNNIDGPAFIYRNNSREQNENSYIGILLDQPGANKFAVGSLIRIYAGNQVFTRELVPTRGFQSSVDYKNIVGLGKITAIDSMMIMWPDRSFSMHYDHFVDTVYIIGKPVNTEKAAVKKAAATLFDAVKPAFGRHEEEDYVDFYKELNVPVMLSREGPEADTADVNNDGLTDIFIGGAANQAGRLYLQRPDGKYVHKQQPVFDRSAKPEDTAVLFFDCDNDGDADLFLGAGGNSHEQGHPDLQHRIYVNDGKGIFSMAENQLPANGMNISTVIAMDFDKDGDLDLFIGGRSVPFVYGAVPQSYLLENDGKGNFDDVTRFRAPELAVLGMVTGAVWADMNGDGEKDLVVCGEWMAPRIFSFVNNGFAEIRTSLENMFGWWQTVAARDVNGDGQVDLILGNVGSNFRLKPEKDHPVKLWVNDFDRNGAIDKVITHTVKGKDIPVFVKNDLEDQFPFLKKQNMTHEAYAKKSIDDLFPAETIQSSVIKEFNYSASCVAVNEGNGKFTIKQLPPMVQLSSVNTVCITDLNNDGAADILAGGNKAGFLPQFGRLDASYGHVLLNDGSGNFSWIGPARSGILVSGETKTVVPIGSGENKRFLFLRNDDFPEEYKLKIQQP